MALIPNFLLILILENKKKDSKTAFYRAEKQKIYFFKKYRTTAVSGKWIFNKKKPGSWSKNEEDCHVWKPKTDPESILTIFPSTIRIFSKLNIFFDAASLPDNEFFVDRDPGSFNTVLNYHRFKIQTLSVFPFFCLFDCTFFVNPLTTTFCVWNLKFDLN